VTIQGGEFGGARIENLRTEIPLAARPQVSADVVGCDQTLLNGR
jgi:hypothetical protein